MEYRLGFYELHPSGRYFTTTNIREFGSPDVLARNLCASIRRLRALSRLVDEEGVREYVSRVCYRTVSLTITFDHPLEIHNVSVEEDHSRNWLVCNGKGIDLYALYASGSVPEKNLYASGYCGGFNFNFRLHRDEELPAAVRGLLSVVHLVGNAPRSLHIPLNLNYQSEADPKPRMIAQLIRLIRKRFDEVVRTVLVDDFPHYPASYQKVA